MDSSRSEGMTLPAPSTVGELAARRRGVDWARAEVSAAMSRPVLTIEVGESLWDAWQLLSVSGLRHLVVVDDGRCLGVISDRMILTDLPMAEERMRARNVGDLLSRAPARSVLDTAPLADVARTMARHSAEAVPVLDALGRLVGIVTASDLVRWWADDGS
ncbi:MAG: CBS domain-containing protein [Candidatus Nanopelagicales bacterium]|jgi:CBS domain-containing protein|nr:CBS domain-containing protein [Candidatus Nanopelagicales bacterium]